MTTILIIDLIIGALQLPTTFQEGMVWETTVYGTHEPDMVRNDVRYELKAAPEIGEEDILKMVSYQNDEAEERFECYIQTSEDKVYFKKPEASKDWLLLYDFNLNPEDEAIVYDPMSTYSNRPPVQYGVKWISTQLIETSEFSIYAMKVETWEIGSSTHSDTGIWIKGIGSVNGPLDNCRFNLDGGVSILDKVTLNGETLYDASASTPEISDDRSITIAADGILTVSSEIPTYVYDSAGNITYILPAGKNISQHLDKGCHIIVTGSGSRKVLIR